MNVPKLAIECIKMVITPLVINVFLTPLDSAHTDLSIHVKNSFFLEKFPGANGPVTKINDNTHHLIV